MRVNKHKSISFILAAAMVLTMGASLVPFAGLKEVHAQVLWGGTAVNPYHVSSWSELSEKMAAGGYIVLDDDLKAGAGETCLIIPSGVTVDLDLNGHIIDRGLSTPQKDGNVIGVYGTLNLKDSRPENVHSTEISYTLPSGVKVTVNGGVITGGYNNNFSGGIDIKAGGRLDMYGGNISCNISEGYEGGGVYNNGYFTMYGGTISGNSAEDGGGVYIHMGSFEMYGGSITGNGVTRDGGGVYIYGSCTFEMYGGSIDNNSANGDGGGVYNINEIRIYGGLISNNVADADNNSNGVGGGLFVSAYQYPEGKVFMNGGVISYNKKGVLTDNNLFFNGNDCTFVWESGTIKTKDDEAYDSSKMKLEPQIIDKKGDLGIYNDYNFSSRSSDKVPTGSYISDKITSIGSGSYQLTDDIFLEDVLKVQTNGVYGAIAYLDLNGHAIVGADTKDTISVTLGSILVISDSNSKSDHGDLYDYTDPVTQERVHVTGGIITHIKGESGRGIHLTNTYLTMFGGTVCNNRIWPENEGDSAMGAGILYETTGDNVMSHIQLHGNTRICGNTIEQSNANENKGGGAGLAILASGTFDGNLRMFGASAICGNRTWGEFGGGIFTFSGEGGNTGKVDIQMMNESRIENNLLEAGGSQAKGGGIAMISAKGGGGLYMQNGGVIAGNEAHSGNNAGAAGGGFYSIGADLQTERSLITGNIAKGATSACGGGVSLSGADIDITDSIITGNTAEAQGINVFGAGVAICHDMEGQTAPRRMSVGGKAFISDNYAVKDTVTYDSNVYLPVYDSQQKITLAGQLDPLSRIGVSFEKPPVRLSEPAIFTEGLTSKGDLGNFISNQGKYVIQLVSGEAALMGLIDFTTQPKDLTLDFGASKGNTLSVSMTSVLDSKVTYEWYSCRNKNRAGSEKVYTVADSGSDTCTFTVPTDTAGTFYYYCKISTPYDENTVIWDESDVATVVVNKEEMPIVKVKSVAFTKGTVTVPKGKTKTLSIKIKPSNATNKGVTYKSSNSKVVSVDKNGKVKGIKTGKATITVTTADGKKKAKCTVKVSSMTIKKENIQKKKAFSKWIVTPKLVNDTIKSVKTSDKKLATVALAKDKKSFTISLKRKDGKATVTVTTKSGLKKKMTCTLDM